MDSDDEKEGDENRTNNETNISASDHKDNSTGDYDDDNTGTGEEADEEADG